ncbi:MULTISPECIES: LuxR C-terminal-related transcriptional regulator [unclassified Marinobacter]|uniref:helix-turn-helix transcriptional regulator n=1 Tax=unclassified Marinobacter TaxID=83889 RepID=UPI00200E1F74|nr:MULTISPECIES: LuxR C-terminal-related transcriptional regulator [unclassified Marinobacter]MCL1477191.1 LuxR C-terminal-related transcriptional regulator [Marinobacter sp.]MCL1480668.1 LuxR C-terminal-related transcriptional regulator [Marinobacter sp.]MCL1484893.1 LuxR C-terminal-related transcriptional regulator [Marinobacter sp.]UQG56449.1 LuxR C-terminal-related transcriptional regulator [Marinobacter sp. M4C]UQG65253.1 LuxR C-terminal-related transcriptional regulator [Marinobacter sp.
MRLNIEGVMIDAGKWDLITRLFFVLILITSITDIVTSLWLEIDSLHIVQESVVCVLTLSLLLMLFLNSRAHATRNRQLRKELDEAKIYSAQASKELISAKRIFGEEISNQFSSWGLTNSESDIALFTLKGFSAKEIADFRNVSEKTVRNQLTSIYKKSATTSNVSFIAWFMEDLL